MHLHSVLCDRFSVHGSAVASWPSPFVGLQDAYAPMRDPHGLLAAHRAAAGPVEAGLSAAAAADDGMDVAAMPAGSAGSGAMPIAVEPQGRRKGEINLL